MLPTSKRDAALNFLWAQNSADTYRSRYKLKRKARENPWHNQCPLNILYTAEISSLAEATSPVTSELKKINLGLVLYLHLLRCFLGIITLPAVVVIHGYARTRKRGQVA
jgi:hypothetical protein